MPEFEGQVNKTRNIIIEEQDAFRKGINAGDLQAIYKETVTAEQFASSTEAQKYLRILVVIAAPVFGADDAPIAEPLLDVWGEWRRLRETIETSSDEVTGQGAPVALMRLNPPTREKLYDALHRGDTGYQIVHFIGHATPQGLRMEFENGLEDLVKGDELVRLFSGSPVQLVFLNACQTQNIARALRHQAGIPAIICTHRPITDAEAKLFSQRFYARLMLGDSVGSALTAAKEYLISAYRSRRLLVPDDIASQLAPEEYAKKRPNIIDIVGEANLHLQLPDTRDRASEPLFSLSEPPNNLPYAQLPSKFIGRGRELVQLANWLEEANSPAIVICGIGGIGKSTLAIMAALRNSWRFFGGIVYASAKQRDFTVDELFEQMDAVLGTNIMTGATEPIRWHRAHTVLNAQSHLLLLDNLENLTDEQQGRLAEFLQGVDSRNTGTMSLLTLRPEVIPPLTDLADLYTLRLDSLDKPSAIQLLYERAAEASVWAKMRGCAPDSANRENEIRQMGEVAGLYPGLTIEQINTLSYISELAHRHPLLLRMTVGYLLSNDVEKLKSTLRNLIPPLQEKVEEMIGAMVNELCQTKPEAIQLLQMMLTFQGGASEAAFSYVYYGHRTREGSKKSMALEALARFVVGTSLLQAEEGRFDLHPLVRQYLEISRPPQKDQRQLWNRRHAQYYLTYAKQHSKDYDQLETERPNVLLSIGWCYKQKEWKMLVDYALSLRSFFYRRGYWSELQELLKLSTTAAQAMENRWAEGRLVSLLGHVLERQGRVQQAKECFEQSRNIQSQIGDRLGEARTLLELGRLYLNRDEYQKARQEYLLPCLKFYSPLRSYEGKQGRARALLNLGESYHGEKNYQKAQKYYEQALERFKKLNDKSGIANIHSYLGELYGDQGCYREAHSHYEQSIHLADQLREKRLISATRHYQGKLYYQQKQYAAAKEQYTKSLILARQIGAQRRIVFNLYWLGRIAYEYEKAIEQANQYWREALQIAERIKMPFASEIRKRLNEQTIFRPFPSPIS